MQAYKSILLSYEQKEVIQSSARTEHLEMIYPGGWISLETVSRRMYQPTYHLAAGQIYKSSETGQLVFILPAWHKNLRYLEMHVSQFMSSNICLAMMMMIIANGFGTSTGPEEPRS
jgi:hypothetical protein